MKNRVISRNPGIIVCADKLFVKIDDLPKYFSIPEKFIYVNIRLLLKNAILKIQGSDWIDYNDLTPNVVQVARFPTRSELYQVFLMYMKRTNFKDEVLNIYIQEAKTRANYGQKHTLEFVKKLVPINKYPILKACKTYAVFNFFKEINLVTMLEKFLIYHSIANEDFLFQTNILSTFYAKYNKFLKYSIDSLIHKNLQNTNAAKLTIADKKIIMHAYHEGNNFSFSHILRTVNAARITRGESKQVSKSTIRRAILGDKKFGLATLAREGSDGLNKLMTHPKRQQPYFAGDQFQIDGTRLNFLYKSDDGAVKFLYMVIAIDVYSKKVMGYSLAPSETFANYIECIRMCAEDFHMLPAEILTDNFSSGLNKRFTRFIDDLALLGVVVNKHKPGNPQAKGSLENWFSLFGELYLKEVPGYLGDGIRSKRKNGKPNSDLLINARRQKNLRSKEEIIQMFAQAVIKFNSTYDYKNSTPNQLFGSCLLQNAILLNDDTLPIILMERSVRMLKKNSILLYKGGKYYEYLIWNSEFVTDYYLREITIRYHAQDHNEVLVYEKRGINIIQRIKLHNKIVAAQANQTEADKKYIYQYSTKYKKLREEINTAVKQYKNDLADVPLPVINHKIDSKETIHQAEEKFLINASGQTAQVKKAQSEKKRSIKLSTKKMVLKHADENVKVSFTEMFKVDGTLRLLD